MVSILKYSLLITSLGAMMVACTKDQALQPADGWAYDPTPYNLETPVNMEITSPPGNPLTEQGVKLGHYLFFDPILSGDNTMSCATCHSLDAGTSDSRRFSVGIDGTVGRRNAMPLFNLGYMNEFFWDGRVQGLEMQVIMPIEDHTEMKETLDNLLAELAAHPDYPRMFFEAFGEPAITGDQVARALAQYLRTLVSFNSRYDKAMRREIFPTDAEWRGRVLFNDLLGADCMHCHNEGNNLFGDFKYRNNGITAAATIQDFPDAGRGEVTGAAKDYGTFKTPSLRNVALTAPYMHDGRFATLEEVIEHYSSGLQQSPNINPGELEHVGSGGVQLTVAEKADLLAFLHSLTDSSIFSNPLFLSPF